MTFEINNTETYDVARCFNAWRAACSSFRPELTSGPGQLITSSFLEALINAKHEFTKPFLLLRDAHTRAEIELNHFLHDNDTEKWDPNSRYRDWWPSPMDMNFDTSGVLWMVNYTIEECPLAPTITITMIAEENKINCANLSLMIDDEALERVDPTPTMQAQPEFVERSTTMLLRIIHNKLIRGNGLIEHIAEGRQPLPKNPLMALATFAPARSLISLMEDRVTQ